MVHAAFNDLAQRVLTLNKFEQRNQLHRFISGLNLPEKCHVLDFGCGTGLFAPMFNKLGMNYVGYDIDLDLVSYAHRLYPWARFTTVKTDIQEFGPFNLILMNCCTHHIPDWILETELAKLRYMLSPAGVCLLVDILKMDSGVESFIHKWFMKLEQGKYLRRQEEYMSLMSRYFTIQTTGTWRSHLFSVQHRYNPLYNDLIVIAARHTTVHLPA